jgi:hypothetical protein
MRMTSNLKYEMKLAFKDFFTSQPIEDRVLMSYSLFYYFIQAMIILGLISLAFLIIASLVNLIMLMFKV